MTLTPDELDKMMHDYTEGVKYDQCYRLAKELREAWAERDAMGGKIIECEVRAYESGRAAERSRNFHAWGVPHRQVASMIEDAVKSNFAAGRVAGLREAAEIVHAFDIDKYTDPTPLSVREDCYRAIRERG